MPDENINEVQEEITPVQEEETAESTVNIDQNKYVVINAPNAQKIVAIHEDGGQEGLLPSGGTTGQMLVKSSDVDFEAEWADLPSVNEVPSGGTEGQVLTKTENGYGWEDAQGKTDWTLHSTTPFEYTVLINVADLPESYNKLKIEVEGQLGASDVYINSGVGVVDFGYVIHSALDNEYSQGVPFSPDWEYAEQFTCDIFITLELSKKALHASSELVDAYYGDATVLFDSSNSVIDYGKGNFLCTMYPDNTQFISFSTIPTGTLKIYYK